MERDLDDDEFSDWIKSRAYQIHGTGKYTSIFSVNWIKKKHLLVIDGGTITVESNTNFDDIIEEDIEEQAQDKEKDDDDAVSQELSSLSSCCSLIITIKRAFDIDAKLKKNGNIK